MPPTTAHHNHSDVTEVVNVSPKLLSAIKKFNVQMVKMRRNVTSENQDAALKILSLAEVVNAYQNMNFVMR